MRRLHSAGSPHRSWAVAALLAVVTVTGLSACGSTQPATTAPEPSAATASATAAAVSTVAAEEWLTVADQTGTVVVDVRTPQEYAVGHVRGAVNIDVEDPGFAAEIAKLDPDPTYAVYCRSGNRSTVATQAMVDAGFTTVVNLAGGLQDLQAAGAEVVR